MKRISSSTPTQPHHHPSPANPIPVDDKKNKKKEKKTKPQQQLQPQRIERNVKEKMRREMLKKLYSTLASLLPPKPSMGRMTTPEKVGEAAEYIKELEQQLKEARERKEMLVGTSSVAATATASASPKMEISELGPVLQVLLITGLEHQFMFRQVIRVLHQETIEVLNADFCIAGDTIYHTIHGKIEDSMFCFRAETIRGKLNRLAGLKMSPDDEEKDQQQADQPQQQLCMWDDEIPFDNWDFSTFHD